MTAAGGGLDDAEVERLLHGSLPALRAFVRVRLGPRLAAHQSSSDVVQSVCRELLEERSGLRFADDASFRGWLFTAAWHKILQYDRYWKAQKRDAERRVDEDESLLQAYAHLLTPSREIAAREQIGRLEEAMAQLSEGDRELVALARIAGLPHAEIAARTGRSEEACRQGLRRALVRLSALLAPGT